MEFSASLVGLNGLNRTRTRTNTNPNGTEANAAGRSGNALNNVKFRFSVKFIAKSKPPGFPRSVASWCGEISCWLFRAPNGFKLHWGVLSDTDYRPLALLNILQPWMPSS